MQLVDVLKKRLIGNGFPSKSKKHALESICHDIAQAYPETNAADLFKRLMDRERLGSTGIGHGVAIPHCRIQDLSEPIAALHVLANPVSYDAIDNQPVDIMLTLLVPEDSANSHLQLLANAAEIFNNEDIRDRLRMASDEAEIYQIAANHDP